MQLHILITFTKTEASPLKMLPLIYGTTCRFGTNLELWFSAKQKYYLVFSMLFSPGRQENMELMHLVYF